MGRRGAPGNTVGSRSGSANGSDRTVGERYRRRVLAAATQLGYRANPHAQAVARGATNIVGLVVHDLADPYFSTIADGVIRECEQRDLVVVLASTFRKPERETEYVAALRAQRPRSDIGGSRCWPGRPTC